MDNFDVKLLKRSIGQKRFHQSIRPLYGDHAWAKDLDIVNELGGHTGCVNALSWATNGRLLASGSDDTYLNIWEYNPENQAKPFTLNTSVNTGHHANIFSVKFMPHSNDRTVVTCAGDSEVRIFDLEYGAGAQAATGSSESTRSRRFNNFFGSCRWLTEANTNARVYRSHADRAKRIVTESSPHLFLTCSEDGEVRQWDLRQPSSAYPSPRDARSFGFRRSAPTEGSDDVPPPLISYKRYGLDLNTISCSKSQPHYITLGGAHAHCFLHDRRMLGRNVDVEQGRPASSRPIAGTPEDDSMREATKCVRRFAPNNKRRMRPNDHGRNHITACKISDARPNELISSWSGDHVYSFDIVRGPDARDEEVKQDTLYRTARLTNKSERKRKRTQATQSSTSGGDGAHNGRRLRRVSDDQAENGQTALRVRFENGETEDVEIGEDGSEEASSLLAAHNTLLSEAQKQSERIARALVNLRKTLFDFSAMLQAPEGSSETSEELSQNTASYTAALGQASTLLPEMEQVMREWTYPNTTDEDEILLQNTLRRNRQSSWRFVQAAGSLSRIMGGKIQTSGPSDDPRLQQFEAIRPAPLEADKIDSESQFYYDFTRAIILWLNGGREAVLEGFRKPPEKARSVRYPFDESTSLENLSERLRDYLLPLARDDKPIIDLGTNQFERDELRQLFEGQKSAVHAFTRALDHIELRRHQGTSEVKESSGGVQKRTMDKGAATRFWGEKVGRALLMHAAEGVTFNFVNRAFGGLKVHITPDDEMIDRLLDEAEEQDEMFVDAEESTTTEPTTTQSTTSVPRVTIEEAEEDEPLSQSIIEEEDEDSDNVPDESDDDSEVDSDDEAAQLIMRPQRRLMSTRRALVNNDVDYTSHTKAYKGHCNTRTVKDVNYYGLDDEYVISGSDDGHFFIWDRKTMEIVSVLEGDGEVVNVIQGHPYEPMIACSGIDSTVKIFGPGGDNRERYDARRGINIANPGGGRHSSLGMMGRARRRRQAGEVDSDTEENEQQQEEVNADDPESVVRGGLKSKRVPMDKVYEIISQNNAERQRGVGDAFMTVSDLDDILIRAWLMSNAMVT
ncbi:hypothetical protein LTR70_002326 [Exophiala xenobiotica]|uniref:Uncharacterized protein n=1 Tax=Lithohypha guttulata TaxID=1690604 RepID=A0ABR0KLA8_9EURO|nr:hypothetical protein LTR24_001252 [Lithohypha guttulata]KAK5326061.1 hypothetical protein LTR70_002326 [Exophiala xenobiotica]